jgi:hypothetical protein
MVVQVAVVHLKTLLHLIMELEHQVKEIVVVMELIHQVLVGILVVAVVLEQLVETQ